MPDTLYYSHFIVINAFSVFTLIAYRSSKIKECRDVEFENHVNVISFSPSVRNLMLSLREKVFAYVTYGGPVKVICASRSRLRIITPEPIAIQQIVLI